MQARQFRGRVSRRSCCRVTLLALRDERNISLTSVQDNLSSGLTLRLFGSFEAAIDGLPIEGLHLREGERVLAFLALHHSTPLPYRVLAERFWPSEARLNAGEGGGFPNTRQAIRSLRVALGKEAERILSPEKGSIQLDVRGAKVDLPAFDRLTRQNTPNAWREATTLYRGPLLADWTDSWIRSAREERKRLYEQLLRRLVDEARGRGEMAEMEGWLRRWITSNPRDEEAIRSMMQLCGSLGRYAEAREIFEALALRRRRDGEEVEAETRAADALLRRAREAPPTAVVPEVGRVGEKSFTGAPTTSVSEGVLQARPASAPMRSVALLYRRGAQPDERLVDLLENRLTAAGYTVFVDRNMDSGVRWMRELERQLRHAYAVVPILSATSVHSEMLEFEVETAHQAAQLQGGQPRLLPVRCDYEEPLPEQRLLGAILNPLQYLLWRGAEDDADLIDGLMRAMTDAPREPLALEPVGGAVGLASPFYIVRATDEDFQVAQKRGDSFLLIKGARQMGKTSLLARGLERARQNGARVVLTDLQSFSERKFETAEALLFAFATLLSDQLELEVSPRRDWDDEFDPGVNLERFLRRYVLHPDLPPLVWGMDEVDRLFSCPFRSDIFGLFRSWHNRRALDPKGPWSRLTLAIAYATEAHLFITDINQSPFNIGTRLTLDDFTLSEFTELNRRYGAPLKTDADIASCHLLLHGQPYLSRRALDAMVGEGVTLSFLETRGSRDDGPFRDHLRRLLAVVSQEAGLAEAMQAVLRQQPLPGSEAFYRLRSTGLVRGEAPLEAVPRCPLYTDYFTRHLL
ncbi:MAG: hypothetical protein JWN14_967 [Chthonomonadales bacterium]|nr:hypothetical protein [Chthonomonadales bacterium]